MKNSNSLMTEFLGESGSTKVIDFLLEKRPFDTTKEEVIKQTGVSRNTFFRVWKTVEENNIVKKTRTIGRATLYVIDDGNPVVKKFLELEYSLIENDVKNAKQRIERKVMAKRVK